MNKNSFQKLIIILKNSLYLDERSLSLFRILLGFVGVYRFTLALRWSNEFLSSDGFLPIVTLNIWATRWSLFFMNHTLVWSQFLCLFGIFLSLALIVGYRTRYVIILLWILTTSLTARAHLVENNGHGVFRLMTMWAMFLPLDKYFILNSKNKINNLTLLNNNYFGLPAFALFLQFIMIYFFAGITKNDSFWADNQTAVYSALNLGAFVKPIGIYVSNYFDFTRILTCSTRIVEVIIPFFLLYESKRLPLRSIAVFSLLFIQCCFYLTLEVGIFPFSMVCFATAFIPNRWWDYFVKDKNNNKENKPITMSYNNFFINIFICILLTLAVLDAIDTSFKSKYTKLSNNVKEATLAFRVDQRWWMFVVYEWRDFWIDVEAVKNDGTVIDAWSWYRKNEDTEFNLNRPNDIRELFSEQPWNNYIHQFAGNKLISEWFLYNLCKAYNRENPQNKVSIMKLHYSYRTILGFNNYSPIKHQILKEWNCGN